jgi:hypothetical protein
MHKQICAVHSIITATNVRKLIEETEGKWAKPYKRARQYNHPIIPPLGRHRPRLSRTYREPKQILINLRDYKRMQYCSFTAASL